MIVAVHQPNYAPWLGYFAKVARADAFVFLDDAQFSKNSYINRVQIDAGGEPRWLTVPVSYSFGDPINRVRAGNLAWRRSHLDAMRTHYSRAPLFAQIWAWLADAFEQLPEGNIAASNAELVERIAAALGLRCRFYRSSTFVTGDAKGDDRLIALLEQLGPGACYLSGKGGANYQDPAKFEAKKIPLIYNNYSPIPYPQGRPEFLSGLSVLDALFHLGFEQTAAIIRPDAAHP